MPRWIVARLALALPTVLGVATIVFALLGESAAPADRAALRAELGLDRPVAEQYVHWLAGLARGDLGHSLRSGRPVAELLAERAPATAWLALVALAFAMGLAVPAGILAARRPGSLVDRGALGLSLAGAAIPNFWLGPLLISLFAVELGWLPVSGNREAASVVLPALTLGASMSGILARLLRASILEVSLEDFTRTARAKGLSEDQTLWRHSLPNAWTPVLSVVGLQLGALLGGSVITETIFAWPGVGRLAIESIQGRDFPVAQGCFLTIALVYVLANLATDLAYGLADPRIRHGRRN
jgi:ABC-type dipeptide/oligopeptide/nickel transport system permease component